jgi:hypothetical protein
MGVLSVVVGEKQNWGNKLSYISQSNLNVKVSLSNNMSTIMELAAEVDLEAYAASEEVYLYHLKSSVGVSVTSSETRTLLSFLIRKQNFIIPDKIFSWIAAAGENVSLSDMCLVVDKKKRLERYVNTIISICQTEHFDWLSLRKLDEILIEHNLDRNTSSRIYILKLLSNFNIKGASYKQYPVENIAMHYKKLESCIDELICEAAYLANYKVLKNFIAVMGLKFMTYKFQPSLNSSHSNILNWIKKNILKGEKEPEALLGWTCGPDSARWPSTKLDDYKQTLSLLSLLGNINE